MEKKAVMKDDLMEIGFKEIDENEYSNGDMSIFIVDDKRISLIGDNDDNMICVPTLICRNKKELLTFFKMIEYDFQSKD